MGLAPASMVDLSLPGPPAITRGGHCPWPTWMITVAVLVTAGSLLVSMLRYSPSSCLPVAELILDCSCQGNAEFVTPEIPKSLSLLITMRRQAEPPGNVMG